MTLKPEDHGLRRRCFRRRSPPTRTRAASRTNDFVLIMPLMFGPGDPLLAIGLMHPDLAARRASQRIGSVLPKALEEQFGDKMTPLERTRGGAETGIDVVRAGQAENAGSRGGSPVVGQRIGADAADVFREIGGEDCFVERRGG